MWIPPDQTYSYVSATGEVILHHASQQAFPISASGRHGVPSVAESDMRLGRGARGTTTRGNAVPRAGRKSVDAGQCLDVPVVHDEERN